MGPRGVAGEVDVVRALVEVARRPEVRALTEAETVGLGRDRRWIIARYSNHHLIFIGFDDLLRMWIKSTHLTEL